MKRRSHTNLLSSGLVITNIPWQPLFKLWIQKVVAMAMYYITDKAPYIYIVYFSSASPRQNNYKYNGTVRGALSITYPIEWGPYLHV